MNNCEMDGKTKDRKILASGCCLEERTQERNNENNLTFPEGDRGGKMITIIYLI